MDIKINDFDLESLTEVQTGRLATLVTGFPINGYSRQDLETIESVIPGAFSALDEFNFKEIPTYANTVHYHLVHKRLDELTKAVREQMNSKYDYYLKMFSSTIKELECISTILNNYNAVTPKPLSDDLTCIYIGDNELYDLQNISDVDFSKLKFINGIKVADVQDTAMNMGIIMFNDTIKSKLSVLENIDDYRNEYNGYILKYLLDVPTLTYDNLISLFANSKEVVVKINILIKEIISLLGEFRQNLRFTDCISTDRIENWVTRCIDTSKYIPLAGDRQSGLTLDFLATFRYYNSN